VATFGGTETVDYWLAGKVAFQIWFIDINEWGQMGTPAVKGDVANALMPGYRDPETGKVIRRAMSPYNRVWLVPKNMPEKVKQAAFYVAYHVSSKHYSIYSTADLYCGMDPYMYSHYTDEGAMQYTRPNPLRGVAPDWPENIPCFPTFEEARAHLDGGLANFEVAFPEIAWPGSTLYTEALARWVQRAMAGEVSPKEAVENAAREWEEIRDRLGKEKQKKYYQEFVEKGKKLGLW
jgi:ABC-type glycerol-3-phosphate transport system substrate-binding protein